MDHYVSVKLVFYVSGTIFNVIMRGRSTVLKSVKSSYVHCITYYIHVSSYHKVALTLYDAAVYNPDHYIHFMSHFHAMSCR